jgi:hypothetical protein
MLPSPSQDPDRQAQGRARMRALRNSRTAGGLLVFTVMAVLGVVGLATGHEGSGLAALVIGGLAVIGISASLGRRS